MEQIVEPKTLAGFMELLPEDQILFNEMIEKIKTTYERFGFLPIDTPIVELSDVLLAKAGGETEKQIYRFTKGENDLSLRFDLTVPLAKYVAQYYGNLSFPFRRYQIGKVYRGEKPQKGRFREFYQCDIDVIGDEALSILNDAEIPSIIYTLFKNLGFEHFKICINNRKILNGLFSSLDLKEISSDIMRTIDKIDKIGKEKVEEELKNLNIAYEKINKIMEFISIDGSNDDKLIKIENLQIKNEIFTKGLEELKEVVKHIRMFGVPNNYFKIDLKIARGLDYYTGTVYETFLDGLEKIGSVCSGGRYDNLAEFYTNKKLPGVGISIGFTRLFDQLKQNMIINSEKKAISKVLVVPMEDEIDEALSIATALRNKNINAQVYMENKKVKNKFKYADKLSIPYVIVIGKEEIETKKYTLKNMITGEQEVLDIESIISKVTF